MDVEMDDVPEEWKTYTQGIYIEMLNASKEEAMGTMIDVHEKWRAPEEGARFNELDHRIIESNHK